MNVVAQIGHVLAKDLRQARWPIAAYFGLVLIATAHSLAWNAPLNDVLDFTVIAVVVVGLVCVASVIQADSPTQANAFWASHPFAPWAVLGAKLMLAAVIIVGSALIGQTLGLAAHGVPAGEMPQLVFRSLWEYGMWILFAMIVAALTTDLRTFLLALILVPISLLIVAVVFILPRLSGNNGSTVGGADVNLRTVWLIALVGGIAGGLALLASVYRTRDSRRYVWVLGAFCAACALLLVQGPLSGTPAANPMYNDGPQATFTLSLDNPQSLPIAPRINLTLTAEAPDQASRLVLSSVAAKIYVRNGPPIPIPMFSQGGMLFTGNGTFGTSPGADAVLSSSSNIQLDSTTRWLGPQSPRTIHRGLSADLTAEQMAAVARGVDSVRLDGVIYVDTPSLLGTMPLTAGATLSHDALRARIRSWAHARGQANLSVDLRWIPLEDRVARPRAMVMDEAQQFALWNPSRREAVELRGANRGGTGWLVLPGVSVSNLSFDLELSADYMRGAAVPLEDSWFDGARLVIIRWTSSGSYPIHVTTKP